jgi:DNA-directed RNA polymerase specialized sigma24 family protein
MTTPLSVGRSDLRRTELNEAVPNKRPEGPDRLSGQQQASHLVVQNKDDRVMFDEVFLPHMAEAYRLAQWLTGNAYDAEDVVQDAALRAFRGIKSFGAINARAWSLTIVRNTAYSWLLKSNRNLSMKARTERESRHRRRSLSSKLMPKTFSKR